MTEAERVALAKHNLRVLRAWDGPIRDRRLRDANIEQVEAWLEKRGGNAA